MIDHRYEIKTYKYGKNSEKSKRELHVHFSDEKYAILETFLESEIAYSSIEESLFATGLKSVLSGEKDYFELTGNACTLEAKKDITTIFDALAPDGIGDYCEISTSVLLDLIEEWDKLIEKKNRSDKESEELSAKVDSHIIKYMKDTCNMTEKQIAENMNKLNRHKDIKNELCLTLIKGYILGDKALVVSGYTAEQLEKNTYLNTLGAYNYLIFLRENPEKALDLLNRGLPRR